MTANDLGWNGVQVRHADGRTGTLRESIGFRHVHLTIWSGTASRHDARLGYVQLNVDADDRGDTGWEWHCVNFDGGPRWLPLGNHW